MELTDQQNVAQKKIVAWFSKMSPISYHQEASLPKERKRIFVLAGYAGTGKTTLAKYVIDNTLKLDQDEVAFIAPTGKAASVLVQKGTPNAQTIHRLIYLVNANDEQLVVNGKTVVKKHVSFVKRKEIGNLKLIVLDEVSMVSKKMMEDIMSFGIPVLAMGDIAQLPPVMSEPNGLLDDPNYCLTEIVRQQEDNAIVKISADIRNGVPLQYGEYGNGQVRIINKAMIGHDNLIKEMLAADQVICGINVTRSRLNGQLRYALGHMSEFPEDGEKLICDLNNYDINFGDKNEYPLVNGMIGYCKDFKLIDRKLGLASISLRPDFLTDDQDYRQDILCESSPFNVGTFNYEKRTDAYLLENGFYAIKQILFRRNDSYESKDEYQHKIMQERLNQRNAKLCIPINQFEYGYAISCHKSQGSEWDTVVVIDESSSFKQDAAKWLYTAVTRAKKKLILIR